MQNEKRRLSVGYLYRDPGLAAVLENAQYLKAALTPFDLGLGRGRVKPFNDSNWLYEVKFRGYRTLVLSTGRSVTLLTRNGTDLTFSFPDLQSDFEALPACAIDCDLFVLANDGRPDYAELTSRAHFQDIDVISAAAIHRPASLMAFDLLSVEGRDIRNEPIEVRKKLLKMLLTNGKRLQYGSHSEDGIALSMEIESKGYEGVLARRLGSPYMAGACNDWLKFKR